MKFTFLGTSAGKPTKERNVSALALEFDQDNKWYLFDCGEATQHQLLHTPLSLNKLDTIFITHLHGDHYYGLLGLLSSKTLDKSETPLRLYGPQGIKKFLTAVIDLSYEHLGYRLDIVEVQAQEQFKFDKFSLKILPLHHSVESFAYLLEENNITKRLDEKKLRADGLDPSPLYAQLKCKAYIIVNGKKFIAQEYMLPTIKGRRVIIAGDNQDPQIMGDALDTLDLLIHESTYTQTIYDALPKKFLHTTANDLGIAAQQHKIKNLIATHISPRYSKSNLGTEVIYEEITKHYKGKAFIANDFDIFYLSKEKRVTKIN